MVSSTPRPHFTPGKDPVPILQEAGWASGPVWTGGKSRPHWDSISECPARSQSLYRLNCRAYVKLYIFSKWSDICLQHSTTSAFGYVFMFARNVYAILFTLPGNTVMANGRRALRNTSHICIPLKCTPAVQYPW